MKPKPKYSPICTEASLYLRFLYQESGLRGNALSKALKVKGFPAYSKRSIRRHAQKPMFEKSLDKRKLNKGRPYKLNGDDEENLISNLKKLRSGKVDFCSVQVQEESGINEAIVGNRTVRRALNRNGYHYLQCRKKGLLSEEDLQKRLKFATEYLKMPEKFWRTGISFYFDGTGWVHKTNPSDHVVTLRTRTWRKHNEGLDIHCTAKGKKEGVGGLMARFMVAISYSKGVIDAIHYQGNINGEKFSNIVKKNFPTLFEKSSNNVNCIFLQDGDPSQNSAIARDALETMGYWKFSIPPRSPDLNPIENIFHLVGKKIKKDGVHITKETYDQFVARCAKTLKDFPSDIIDRTIDSMPNRLHKIIERNGQRTKY